MAVTIKGLRELETKFKKLQANTQGKILENAVLAGTTPILNAAIDKVPVDTHTLQRSLHPEIIERGNTKVMGMVGTDVEYAPYVEFGTDRQSAQPYLRPAFDTQKNNAVNEISAALKEQIENVN